MNVKFAHTSSVVRHVGFDAIHVCDAEFSVHAPVAITLITSHYIAAASHPNYLKAGVHLLRANADVAPWLTALLAGCSSGSSSAWAGIAAAAVTLAVSVVWALHVTFCCTPPPSTAANAFLSSGQHAAAESVTPFPLAPLSHPRCSRAAAAASGCMPALTPSFSFLSTSHLLMPPSSACSFLPPSYHHRHITRCRASH